MALEIPDSLLNLEANCGVFAVWMLLQHHGTHVDMNELIKLCRHDRQDGTFTIAFNITPPIDLSFFICIILLKAVLAILQAISHPA